jgi:hypothetical protein
MKPSSLTNVFGILVLGLLMIFAVATDTMAQGRGRRAGNWDKKCSKFVNCHDARDGRWDGRGPNRRSRSVNIFRRNRRDRDFTRFERRGRRHNRDLDHNRWERRRR